MTERVGSAVGKARVLNRSVAQARAFGSGGSDTIDSEPGNDVVCGRDGDDHPDGGAGDDVLIGNAFNAMSPDD